MNSSPSDLPEEFDGSPIGLGGAAVVKVLAFALAGLLALALVAGIVFPRLVASRDEARRMTSLDHLRKIAAAAIDYDERVGHLPPPRAGERPGSAVVGWQTAILAEPASNHADVFQRIDFDQPWDAPLNLEPFATRIPEFLNPALSAVADEAGYALSHYAGNERVLSLEGGPSLAAIDAADGAKHTLLAGEVVAGLRPWGDPAGVRDPARGLAGAADGFGAPWAEGTQFAFADGSARLIARDVPAGLLRGLADPFDGPRPPDP